MNEKRNYKKNGLGRRDYDKSPCPFYDIKEHKCKEVEGLKKELSTKIPWSIFALFVASMITLSGIYLNYEMSKTEKTFDVMIELKEKNSRIEANQKAIMEYLKSKRKNKSDFPY